MKNTKKNTDHAKTGIYHFNFIEYTEAEMLLFAWRAMKLRQHRTDIEMPGLAGKYRNLIAGL